MYFNVISENKILVKISTFTVYMADAHVLYFLNVCRLLQRMTCSETDMFSVINVR